MAITIVEKISHERIHHVNSSLCKLHTKESVEPSGLATHDNKIQSLTNPAAISIASPFNVGKDHIQETVPCNARAHFNELTRDMVQFRAYGRTYTVEVQI